MSSPYPSSSPSMPSEPIDPAGPNVGNNPPANQNIEEVKNESGAPSPRISQDVTDKTNESNENKRGKENKPERDVKAEQALKELREADAKIKLVLGSKDD